MTRHLPIALVALVAAAGLTRPAAAQDALVDHPGYVDFGNLSSISASEPEVEISLGGALLRFLCAAVKEEDEELSDTLCKLRSVRISVFDLATSDAAAARERSEQVSRQLETGGWEPAVVLRDRESTVRMYMRSSGDTVVGMAVMVVEPGSDAVFMNIVGDIDPAQLGRVAAQFGVDLNDIKVDGG